MKNYSFVISCRASYGMGHLRKFRTFKWFIAESRIAIYKKRHPLSISGSLPRWLRTWILWITRNVTISDKQKNFPIMVQLSFIECLIDMNFNVVSAWLSWHNLANLHKFWIITNSTRGRIRVTVNFPSDCVCGHWIAIIVACVVFCKAEAATILFIGCS